MANKIRFWQSEELKSYGLVDVTPRHIKGSDIVAVKCRACDEVHEIRLSILMSKMITYKTTWRCSKCGRLEKSRRGKQLVGANNPFYGKKHSKQTQEKMKVSSRRRWDNTSKEDRLAIGEAMRRCAYDKYGGNPMSDPQVRQKYLEQVRLYWESPLAKENIEKRKETCLKRYGATTYVHSDEYIQENKRFTAKAEVEIINFLGVEARKRRLDGVELDIYIPSVDLAIEYNGAYWHSEIFRDRAYHLRKTEYCEANGINLIQIFDHEWKNRRRQIESFLMAKVGRLPKIGARSCKVVELKDSVAQEFAENHHIQGGSRGSVLCLGLEYRGELVSIGIFGRHHRQLNKVVLKRFVSKSGLLVIGALSKISKHASNRLKSDIITWADRRITSGSSYLKAGWVAEEVLPPDYFYIKNGRYHCSKQSRRKSVVGTPNGMTEHEHAMQDGLLRVYDCGKIRFVYKYSHADEGQFQGPAEVLGDGVDL